MTSIDFPTLTQLPSQDGFKRKMRPFSLNDATEYPYTFSRRKASRNVKGWVVPYVDLHDANYQLLMDFFDLVQLDTSFNWMDPTLAASVRTDPDIRVDTTEVRFTSFDNPEYGGFGPNGHYWNVSFEVDEV